MKKIILTFIFLSIVSYSWSQNIDVNILKTIYNNRNTELDKGYRFLSNTTATISIATPIIIYSTGLFQKNKSLKEKALIIGESTLAAAITSTVLKYSINRDRPFEKYPLVFNKDINASSPSFPSGHTSSAFATATSLSLAFPKWYVIVPSYAWASSVGYSRMHFGVHYPSDVLAGAVIGAGTAYLTHYINKKLRE